MNVMKWVYAIFTLYQQAFCCFLQASKDRKWCDNDFKIFWANYCSSTITDSAKQKRKEIFEARIFSHPLRFFHSYLIYFYSYWTFPHPHVNPSISILTHLKRLLKKVSPRAYFRILQIFLSEQLFIRQLWTVAIIHKLSYTLFL